MSAVCSFSNRNGLRGAVTATDDGDNKESLPNLLEEEDVGVQTKVLCGTQRSSLLPNSNFLLELYGPSVEAKIWFVASRHIHGSRAPTFYPEYTKPGGVHYVYRELNFWTSGFFPGSLHLLLERRRRYPTPDGMVGSEIMGVHEVHEYQLEYACKMWTENLHVNAHLCTTHDLGFMIMPWARIAYELNHDLRALDTIKTAANTLYSRFNKEMGCIRSWDKCVTNIYNFYDLDKDYMVIIDNMMNLDLLFYASSKTGNTNMFDAAVEHARTTMRTHIRSDGSTTHLIVLNPQNGGVKDRLTNQGYSHTSCWARGQAWAIAGFAETYVWTKDLTFLNTARRCADYFLKRLSESDIVPWDFDAPAGAGALQPPDVSAAVIAAYGMLLIHQAMTAAQLDSSYLTAALKIVHSVCKHHLNDRAYFTTRSQILETVEHGAVKDEITGVNIGAGDTILQGATINNFEHAPRRWADHGLVYADYYFLLIGNKLLELGIARDAVPSPRVHIATQEQS